jgi:hypothetical protein
MNLFHRLLQLVIPLIMFCRFPSRSLDSGCQHLTLLISNRPLLRARIHTRTTLLPPCRHHHCEAGNLTYSRAVWVPLLLILTRPFVRQTAARTYTNLKLRILRIHIKMDMPLLFNVKLVTNTCNSDIGSPCFASALVLEGQWCSFNHPPDFTNPRDAIQELVVASSSMSHSADRGGGGGG